MVAAQRELFDATPSIRGRTVYEGVGEGGDHSLAIDRRCEDIVFAELDELAGEGLSLAGDLGGARRGWPWDRAPARGVRSSTRSTAR